ncbi:MAG: spinster family MFS transporter [Alphaproteobacteria bacterium]
MNSTASAEAPGTPAAPEITPAYRRYALFMLVVVYTSSHVDRNIMAILIEPIKRDMGWSDVALGFLAGPAFAMFYATLGIPVAWLADKSNRRNIIAWAIAIWSAMTALCGLAQNFWQLALARIGVGVGEAGSSPPSHSMISDLYPPEKRSRALAIYALGVYIGIMLGYLIGGHVSEAVGWRAAFFVVGLPGLIIALLVRFTLKEPLRGHSEGVAVALEEKVPFTAGFKHIWRSRAARHLVIGCTLTSFVGYGTVAWNPAYLIRSLGMTEGEVGTMFAPLMGVLGAAGALLGGYLADRLAARDRRWNAWIVALTKAMTVPLLAFFYLATDQIAALLWFAPTIVLGAFYLGPTFAMIQTLSPPRLRAMSAAILLLILNLIGLGLGPQLVGVLSEFLRPELGKESLRYALLISVAINLWAAGHYVAGGIYFRREMEAAAAKA